MSRLFQTSIKLRLEMISVGKSALSRNVTTMRIKEAMSQLGCLVCDQQYVDMSKPNTKQDGSDPSTQFPEVWRDQVSANIKLAATPEGRSLTSV